ncbi:MAG: hypothetical protein JO165_07965 [Candidatus Eremiobacteraeota bacterium]|nr:hypothetical protein [Candidatus Eremiobacteraeota bacterium]
MSKLLRSFGLFLILGGCSGAHNGLVPQPPSSLYPQSLAAQPHYLYAEVQCSNAPIRACIDTFRYDATSHTLHLMRRLAIPVSVVSFALDKQNDIVVGTQDGIFYYHHDDAAFTRPFKSLYARTSGEIAISGDDTLFQAAPLDANGNDRILGYKNASTLTNLGVANFHHTCTADPTNTLFGCGAGMMTADAYNNVYQVDSGCNFLIECVLGWRPSDAAPSYISGDQSCLTVCSVNYYSLTFDPTNYLVENSASLANDGSGGLDFIAQLALLSPPTTPRSFGFNFGVDQYGQPPYYSVTDDGVNTVFLTAYYGQSTTGYPYGEIVMLDYGGHFLGRLTNIAAVTLLYK